MKATSKNTVVSIGGGLAGLALTAVIIVAANVIIGSIRLRADMTEEKLYTLSDGTINLLKKMEQPVTLKLFFSSSSASVPSNVKAYAKRVEDLLWEYKSYAASDMTIEKFDPKPDSDAEDWATRYGVAAQTVDMFGPSMFFGLVAVSGDVEGIIPAFNPGEEELLEYNLTRLIYRVTNPQKPRVGVISSLGVMGQQAPQFAMPGQPRPQSKPAWYAIRNIRQEHAVEDLGTDIEAIDPSLDAVVVIHPKNLSDKTLYAIDQYVLGGGHLLAFVDPLSIADEGGAMAPRSSMPQRSSNLGPLFDAWGIGFEADKVVADMKAATMLHGREGRPERNMIALSMTTNNISRDEIITAKLDSMMLPFVGSLSDNTGEDLTFTPLLYSSSEAGTVGAMMAQFGGAALQKEFKDSPTRLTIAARLSGNLKTAFPDGAPMDEEEDGADAENKETEETPGNEGLKSGESTVIVVADVDLIHDPICVEQVNVFGFAGQRARNDNLSFFANAVEMAVGSENLIAVRSRGSFSRPFDRVLALQAKAMREWQGRETELEEKLRETERKLREMQSEKQSNQRAILSAGQRETIANFRKEELRVKRQLKDVRKNLRRDIERLGMKVKVINIALMPLLVSLAGVSYGLYRRRRG